MTHRTLFWLSNCFFRSISHFFEHSKHFWDNITCFFYDNFVANFYTKTKDLVHIVKRRMRHRRPCELDRIHVRDRGEHTSSSHLPIDIVNPRRPLLGWELHGNRPSWRLTSKPERILIFFLIYFYHNAVDPKWLFLMISVNPFFIHLPHIIHMFANLPIIIRWKFERAELFQFF